MRASGFGFLNGAGRIGSIITMQLLKLDQAVVAGIFAFMSIAAAIATFTLPETFKKPLPQTLDEAEIQMSEKNTIEEKTNRAENLLDT